ncbi:MAG: SusC/RagA family TonB-linked outer membrane protein [Bacteroidota bacterium]
MKKTIAVLFLLTGFNVLYCDGQERGVPIFNARYEGAANAKPLKDILNQIQDAYKINLLFETKLEGVVTSYSLKPNKTVDQVLKELLTPLKLTWVKVNERNYIIKSRLSQGEKLVSSESTYPENIASTNSVTAEKKNTIIPVSNASGSGTTATNYTSLASKDTAKLFVTIKGRIVSEEKGEAIGFANVFFGTSHVTTSDAQGYFSLAVPAGTKIIGVSHVNYQAITVQIRPGESQLAISMKLRSELSSVTVSTGMFTRKRESFTGAAVTYTAEQLKISGNQNIIQSLKTLDPSFIVMENNEVGSDPNAAPSIQVRGQSSLTTNTLKDQFNSDPNLPLFILDGFAVSLQTINDLDINRIAGVTILKDASSAAMYGARAANGVVVVETKRPVAGKMRITYTGDFSLQAPDLRGYNMMNSSEELQFEKLAGRYKPYLFNWYNQNYLDDLYNSHLINVQKGVNTYWLSEPLQTGSTKGNSIYAETGDSSLRLGIGLSLKRIDGVMKGSDRQNMSGNVDFGYRKKNFNLINSTYINGYTSDNSPYGNFQNFVNAPAYFTKRDSAGNTPTFLEISKDYNGNTFYVNNPLYNAMQYGINSSKNLGFKNNLQVTYSFNPYLQLQGALSISKSSTTSTLFIAPENTMFKDSSSFGKGYYSNTILNAFNYQANASLAYGRLFNRVHMLTVNLRAELEENSNNSLQFAAIGFPGGTNGNPAFSHSYQNNSKPVAATSLYRRNNMIGSVNYTYDYRFFVDGTYRIDGSTAFGSNKKFSGFYSAGVGWNLQNEAFLKKVNWINTLRVRLNTGTSSNQSFGALTSVSVYSYDSYVNLFGQGLELTTPGNPDLQWQKTTQTNLGADITLFRNKITLSGNVFKKITDPMVFVAPLPSSTGIANVAMNGGSIETQGVDLTARYVIINRSKDQILWNVSANMGMYKSIYQHFNNTLDALNKTNQKNQVLTRYADGYSPNDLWAVPSLGIDPGTGQEVFLKKNGQSSFVYDPNDAVKVGNSQPAVQGVVSTYVSWKGFSVSAALRYSLGEDVFNTALYNKVENISYTSIGNNQDRRALYDRWQNPGDIAQFKGIYLVSAVGTGATPMSSRFIQRENYISGESFSIGYDASGKKWVRSLKMQGFRVRIYANELFHISTIQRERGTAYPFANTFSGSISTTF